MKLHDNSQVPWLDLPQPQQYNSLNGYYYNDNLNVTNVMYGDYEPFVFSGDIAKYKFNIKKLQKNQTFEDTIATLIITNFTPNEKDFHICGVSSTQKVIREKLPNKFICLQNSYIEYCLFKLGEKNTADAISNIVFYIKNSVNLDPEFKAEIVLKINGGVICSKKYEHGNKIEFINNPNIILLYRQFLPHISVHIRIKKNVNISNIKYCLLFDSHHYSYESRHIMLTNKCYNFKTSSGIKIVSTTGLFAPRNYTDLYNSVDNEFKFLYDSNKVNNETNNISDDDLTLTVAI